MTSLTGTYKTENALKYLVQLCKHFGHKVPATVTEETGHVEFAFGPADLSATGDHLKVVMMLTSEDDIEKAKHVIDAHLARFAFRENFTAMDWSFEPS